MCPAGAVGARTALAIYTWSLLERLRIFDRALAAALTNTQDFEAITPNILCRTIETVEGGGAVILLLHSMTSLKQLYTMTMDVHARFRTEAHQDVVGRFNERFLLSLASCTNCLVLDDELNVLPIR